MRIMRLRFSIFCLIIFSIICLPLSKPVLSKFSSNGATYFFYCAKLDSVNNALDILQNGNGSIVVCDVLEAEGIKSELTNIYGESIRMNFSFSNLQKIFNSELKKIGWEKVQDYQIYYFYDSSLPKYVLYKGQKVNVQMALNESEINIGYPLILNGY